METAHTFDALVAGAKKKMVGVGENDFGVKIVAEIAWGQAFYGALCAHRHEDWGFDDAMGRTQKAGASPCLRAGGLNFKAKRGHCSDYAVGDYDRYTICDTRTGADDRTGPHSSSS